MQNLPVRRYSTADEQMIIDTEYRRAPIVEACNIVEKTLNNVHSYLSIVTTFQAGQTLTYCPDECDVYN